MNHTIKAHIGSQAAEELIVKFGDPLKMHKTRFEDYLRWRMSEGEDDKVLIKLINQWKAEARRLNKARA